MDKASVERFGLEKLKFDMHQRIWKDECCHRRFVGKFSGERLAGMAPSQYVIKSVAGNHNGKLPAG